MSSKFTKPLNLSEKKIGIAQTETQKDSVEMKVIHDSHWFWSPYTCSYLHKNERVN